MLGQAGGGSLSPQRRRRPAAGNFDGLGAVRSRELVAAAAELGVVEARIKVECCLHVVQLLLENTYGRRAGRSR